MTTQSEYPLIISFYTDDWEYPLHAARLRAECEALGLRYRIERKPTTGSYLKNCCIKPSFILECLKDEQGPVLWIDVDGSIVQKPDFFLDNPDDYDFQARRMDPNHRKRTWHVGTQWWNYTDEAIAFMDRWIANTGDMTDESALEVTVRQGEDLRTRNIPAEYFMWSHHYRDKPDKVVIYHRESKSDSKKRELPSAIRYERNVI